MSMYTVLAANVLKLLLVCRLSVHIPCSKIVHTVYPLCIEAGRCTQDHVLELGDNVEKVDAWILNRFSTQTPKFYSQPFNRKDTLQ